MNARIPQKHRIDPSPPPYGGGFGDVAPVYMHPPSFSRPAPSMLTYAPFRTTAHVGFSANIAQGFPVLPPPGSPFADHDVVQQDWARFLEDIKHAGAPDGAPVRMRHGPVGELLDQWNHYFFHPRKLHVVLALGNTAYTGRDTVPADAMQQQNAQRSFYEDDGSEDDEGRVLGGRPRLLGGIVGGLLDGREARRDARRKRRHERGGLVRGLVSMGASALSGAMSNGTAASIPGMEQKWRLVISYRA